MARNKITKEGEVLQKTKKKERETENKKILQNEKHEKK